MFFLVKMNTWLRRWVELLNVFVNEPEPNTWLQDWSEMKMFLLVKLNTWLRGWVELKMFLLTDLNRTRGYEVGQN